MLKLNVWVRQYHILLDSLKMFRQLNAANSNARKVIQSWQDKLRMVRPETWSFGQDRTIATQKADSVGSDPSLFSALFFLRTMLRRITKKSESGQN